MEQIEKMIANASDKTDKSRARKAKLIEYKKLLHVIQNKVKEYVKELDAKSLEELQQMRDADIIEFTVGKKTEVVKGEIIADAFKTEANDITDPDVRDYVLSKKPLEAQKNAILASKKLTDAEKKSKIDVIDKAIKEQKKLKDKMRKYRADIDKLSAEELLKLYKTIQIGLSFGADIPSVDEQNVKKVFFADRVYIRKKENKDNNLKYFFKDYDQVLMSPNLRDFIIETTGRENTLAPGLIELIENGTLTEESLYRWFRYTEEKINQETFDLLNKYIFKNNTIDSMEQLEKLIGRTSLWWAAATVMKERGNAYEQFLFAADDADSFIDIVTALDIAFANEITQKAAKFDISKIDGKAYEYARVFFMEYFDGTVASAFRCAYMIREVMREFNLEEDYKPSLDQVTGGRKGDDKKGTLIDNLADNRSDIEENTDKKIEQEKIKAIVSHIFNFHTESEAEEALLSMASDEKDGEKKMTMVAELTRAEVSDKVLSLFDYLFEVLPNYVREDNVREMRNILKSLSMDLFLIENISTYFTKFFSKFKTADEIKERNYLMSSLEELKIGIHNYSIRAAQLYNSLDIEVLNEKYNELKFSKLIGLPASEDTLNTDKNIKVIEKRFSARRKNIVTRIKTRGNELVKWLNNGIFKYNDLPKDVQTLIEEIPSETETGKPTYRLKPEAYSVGRGAVAIKTDVVNTGNLTYKPVVDTSDDEQKAQRRHDTERIYQNAENLHNWSVVIRAKLREIRGKNGWANRNIKALSDKAEAKRTFAEITTSPQNTKANAEKMRYETKIVVTKTSKRKYERTDVPTSFTINSTIAMPSALEKIMSITFNQFADTRVQFASTDEQGNVLTSTEVEKDGKIVIERPKDFESKLQHEVTNWNAFFTATRDLFDNMTAQEAIDIIEFYNRGPQISFGGPLNKFFAFTIFTLHSIVDMAETNVNGWCFSPEFVKDLRYKYEQMCSAVGSGLNAVGQIASNLRASASRRISQRYFEDFDMTDEADRLYELAAQVSETKDKDKSAELIKKLHEEMIAVEKLLEKRWRQKRGWGKRAWSKTKSLRYMAMLSSPFTWIRNNISNTLLTIGNSLADLIGSKGLFGKIPYRDGQVNLAAIKVSKETAEYVANNFMAKGTIFEDIFRYGGTKYDLYDTARLARNGRNSNDKKLLTQVICSAMEAKFAAQNRWDNNIMNGMSKFVDMLISDSAFIKFAFKKYFSRILQDEVNKGNIDLSTNTITPEVMDCFAEAMIQALQDYQHKGNAFGKMIAILQQTHPNTAEAIQIMFPFIVSGWNWFTEIMRYTPFGMLEAIIRWVKVEKVITAVEAKRAKGEKIPHSRFTEYLVRRDFGKGVIGTIGWVVGIFLGLLGVIRLDEDEDDDKLYLYAADNVKVDITNIFGSSSILFGASMGQAFAGNFDNFDDAMKQVSDSLLSGFFLFDTLEDFQYADDSWSAGTQIFENYLKSFTPQLWQLIIRCTNDKKIKYSAGFVGMWERYLNTWIPTQPMGQKKTNIYTGETQKKYAWPFFGELFNSGIVLGANVTIKAPSETEMFAAEYDINKKELTGEITIGDKKYKINQTAVNEYYGQLNSKTLLELENQSHYVQLDNGTYATRHWSKLTNEERKRVITRTMNKNAQYAKIYVWTKSGGKYYASDSEFIALRQLGISTNVYRGDKGFVK